MEKFIKQKTLKQRINETNKNPIMPKKNFFCWLESFWFWQAPIEVLQNKCKSKCYAMYRAQNLSKKKKKYKTKTKYSSSPPKILRDNSLNKQKLIQCNDFDFLCFFFRFSKRNFSWQFVRSNIHSIIVFDIHIHFNESRHECRTHSATVAIQWINWR